MLETKCICQLRVFMNIGCRHTAMCCRQATLKTPLLPSRMSETFMSTLSHFFMPKAVSIDNHTQSASLISSSTSDSSSSSTSTFGGGHSCGHSSTHVGRGGLESRLPMFMKGYLPALSSAAYSSTSNLLQRSSRSSREREREVLARRGRVFSRSFRCSGEREREPGMRFLSRQGRTTTEGANSPSLSSATDTG